MQKLATHLGDTDRGTEISPASQPLTAKQEAFAVAVAEGTPLWQAYITAYTALGCSRATARANATRLAKQSKVAKRIQQLRDAVAGRSVRSTASLIAELEEVVSADVGEIVRVEVQPCPACWSDGDAGRDANPDCPECHGTGKPRVFYTGHSDLSPGARRLIRGVELFEDGSLKKIMLHDQMAARIELHRLMGLHIERSVAVTLNATRDLRDMTPAQALEFLDSIRPVPATTPAAREPVTIDGEASA